MDKLTVGSIEMTWDPDSRIARLRFTRETDATGRDAVALVDALTRWVGAGDEPFALLGDGRGLRSLDAEYRATWRKFFRHHRGSYLAFFNMGPVTRIAADMFRIGTGLNLKAFATEEEAVAWLRSQGIGP